LLPTYVWITLKEKLLNPSCYSLSGGKDS